MTRFLNRRSWRNTRNMKYWLVGVHLPNTSLNFTTEQGTIFTIDKPVVFISRSIPFELRHRQSSYLMLSSLHEAAGRFSLKLQGSVVKHAKCAGRLRHRWPTGHKSFCTSLIHQLGSSQDDVVVTSCWRQHPALTSQSRVGILMKSRICRRDAYRSWKYDKINRLLKPIYDLRRCKQLFCPMGIRSARAFHCACFYYS